MKQEVMAAAGMLSSCVAFRTESRDRHVRPGEGEFLIVPRGVEHRPVADYEVPVRWFEPAAAPDTGNVRDERAVARPDRI